MKKTFLTALAVLLVMLAVTCDNSTPGIEKEPPMYTEDGRLLVPLTIGTGSASRALTSDLAKNNVTYYEVAFKDQGSTKIYRKAWNYTQTGRIAVPAGTYTGAANAVLLAGRDSDKTLLAVGVITAVDATPGAVILPNTATVTFTLTPLTNNVSAIPITMTNPPDPITATASTFQITGPAFYQTSAYTPATYTGFPRVKMLTDQKTYPLFRVPAGIDITNAPTDITATYAVACGTAGANYAGVMIADEGKLISGPATNLANGVKVSGTIAPVSGAVPATGIFSLKISTDGITSGLSQISIEVPVCAIDITNDSPDTWYIRGGLSQNTLDEGINANTIGSLGGAVLLGVGAVEDTGITIITN
ncbi:MAG: hypothetical protein LBB81_05265 [Treponema sp.]|jgi:hypothetical protein|nr:hypothetical protein [Treponema sp.]